MNNYIVKNEDGMRVFLVGSRDEAENFTVEAAARYGSPATLVRGDGTYLFTAEVGVRGEVALRRPVSPTARAC